MLSPFRRQKSRQTLNPLYVMKTKKDLIISDICNWCPENDRPGRCPNLLCGNPDECEFIKEELSFCKPSEGSDL